MSFGEIEKSEFSSRSAPYEIESKTVYKHIKCLDLIIWKLGKFSCYSFHWSEAHNCNASEFEKEVENERELYNIW